MIAEVCYCADRGEGSSDSECWDDRIPEREEENVHDDATVVFPSHKVPLFLTLTTTSVGLNDVLPIGAVITGEHWSVGRMVKSELAVEFESVHMPLCKAAPITG